MPDWAEYVRARLPVLHVAPEREHEIVAELALQLEQAFQDALIEGVSETEALRRAEAQLGGWERLARDINVAERTVAPEEPARWFSGWLADARYASRLLRRNPAFAILAVFTLGFGIACNTAIFTMVDAVAWRSMPYPGAVQLMAIETRKVEQPELEAWTSMPDLFDIARRAHSFSSIAGISPVWSVVATGSQPPERMQCLYASASFFPILQMEPVLGRVFTPQEDGTAARVALLSYSLWQRRFGGRRDVLGQTLALDVGSYTVIGVLPPDFHYAGEPVAGTASQIELWLPLSTNQLARSARSLRFLKLVGRLNPGISQFQAQDEIRRLGASLAMEYPASNRGFSMGVRSLREQATGRYRLAMLLLLATVGFVLAMACANVASLLLGRASAREREIAVRAAMGASRLRLLRQLLTEGAVLAIAGGVAGLAMARLFLRLLIAYGPDAIFRTREIHLDGRALLFTVAAVCASALLAGLPPAWRAARSNSGASLRQSGRGMVSGHRGLRSFLVVVQVAVALILLVGAGLLIRSFQRLLQVDPGFDPHHLLTVTTLLPNSVRTPAQATAIYRKISDELLRTPGVVSVAAVSRLPLLGSTLGVWVYREGEAAPGRPGFDTEYRVATPGYFSTMGIPLRAGRFFDEHDDANAACCAIINEAAAQRIFPGEDPLGKRISLGTGPDQLRMVTITGVVGNVRHVALDVEPRPEVYRPYAYNPLGNPVLVIRTASDPSSFVSSLTAKVRVDPAMPAYNIFLMQALIDRSTSERRFVMLLLTGFAMAALLLALIGVYGTVVQSVTQRTSEIGLRMALGASQAETLALVFRDGMRLTLTGLALGTAASLALTRLMRNLLFQVPALDFAAFASAALCLAAAGLLACYLPARRATKVDPLTALRGD